MYDKEISNCKTGREVWIAIALFVLNHMLMLFISDSGLFSSSAANDIRYIFLVSILLSLLIIVTLLPIVIYRALNKNCGKISKAFASIFSTLLIVISFLFIFVSIVTIFN